MHTFIFPKQDTFITNETGYADKNFGIDEILEIKAQNQLIKNVTFYSSASLSGSYSTFDIVNYSGGISGSYISGDAESVNIYVSGSSQFRSTNYNGYVSGTYGAGIPITSSLTNYNGVVTGSISGSIVGSFTGSIFFASGSLTNFDGCINGTLQGTQSVYNPTTTFTNDPEFSRILIQFDLTSISSSLLTGDINNGSKFFLKLKASSTSEVPLDYKIYAYPISKSWDMGIGRYDTDGIGSFGANWYYNTTQNTSSLWYSSTASTVTYNFSDYLLTSSLGSSSFQNGGSTWFYNVPSTYLQPTSSTSSSFYNVSSGSKYISSFCSSSLSGSSLICSQSYSYSTSDIYMDVTSIVKSWICGCVPNNGFILISSLELVQSDDINSSIRFFSKETNTIYQPYLDVKWDDSVYSTGSLVSLTGFNPYTVVVKNVGKEYKFGSVPRINIFAREKAPLKNFVKGYQQSQYLSSSLLPTDSYYAIKDNESENFVIDFDDYTKLSCDGAIHYFRLDTTGLPVERYYRILIKTEINGEIVIFDNGNIFKVSR
tara:strand:- start:275 stop:1900 length:1626 start_codon:yes stop_codon:yes gene_type:complete